VKALAGRKWKTKTLRPFTIAAPVTSQSTMTKSNSQFAPADDGFSLISKQKLLTLYSTMVNCRNLAEDSRSRLKNKRPNGSADSILGHEAAAVGAAIDLLPHDTVAPTLWPDAALKAINSSVSIASHISIAARSSLADKDGRKITLLFSSGQRSSQLSWFKTLTLAADHNLPIVFVSLDRPAKFGRTVGEEALPMKRKGHSFPFVAVDGNDVIAVYRVASEAIAHARKGHGPSLIDCRLSIPGDPLQQMEKYLIGKGLEPGKLLEPV
jgi:TPP-dependent pyruvate/acetoin dehydrogenase alpha subunit